jgi:hypothetical protein
VRWVVEVVNEMHTKLQPENQTPFGKPKHSLKDIKMDVKQNTRMQTELIKLKRVSSGWLLWTVELTN